MLKKAYVIKLEGHDTAALQRALYAKGYRWPGHRDAANPPVRRIAPGYQYFVIRPTGLITQAPGDDGLTEESKGFPKVHPGEILPELVTRTIRDLLACSE